LLLEKLRDYAIAIEDTREQLRAREAEPRGHRLRVIVLPDAKRLTDMLTSADFLQRLTDIGFVGESAGCSDNPDTPKYARLPFAQVEKR